MRYMKTFLMGVLLMVSAVVMTGCSDYVGKEKSHPLFVKAGACRTAGNYSEAAQFYEDFLYVCPKSPLAHFELASVYGDNLDDPFRAMYHYEKYLELSPNSSDAEDVKKFSDACRKRIFEKLSKDYVSTEASKAQNDAARYKKKMEEYVEYSRKLRAQNEKMKQMIRSGNYPREVNVRPLRTNESEQPEKTVVQNEQVNTEQTTQQKPAAQTAKTIVPRSRVYTVVSGDSLRKISQKMYGTGKYWKNIQTANPGRVGAKGQIRVGAKLQIPVIGGTR